MICDDGPRQYLWMPLEPDSAIRANAKTVRIESPTAQAGATDTHPKSKRRRLTVTHPPTETNASPPERRKRTACKTEASESGTSPIAQAMALRVSLRATLTQTGELIRALKRQKQQTKLVATTLASLKELQKVAGYLV